MTAVQTPALSNNTFSYIPFVNETPLLQATDTKTYILVVIGKILEVIAIACMAAISFFACVISPYILVGSVPATALFALGKALATQSVAPEIDAEAQAARSTPRSEPVEVPPVNIAEARPLGINNARNNCWAICALQMILALPSLEQAIQNREGNFASPDFDPFRENIQRYRAAQASRQNTAAQVNPQTLRAAFGEPGNGPADATAAFETLAQNMAAGRGIRNLVRMDDGYAQRYEPVSSIRLTATLHGGRDFTAMLDDYFDYAAERRQFTTAPQEFVVHMERTHFAGGAARITGDAIAMPDTVDLPARYTVTNEAAQYECDFFMQYTHGHYICFVKKPSGWWKCDDQAVTRVNTPMPAEITRGSLYHFLKI